MTRPWAPRRTLPAPPTRSPSRNVNEAPTAVALANDHGLDCARTPRPPAHIKVADINVTDDALGSNDRWALTGSGCGLLRDRRQRPLPQGWHRARFREQVELCGGGDALMTRPWAATPDATSATYTVNLTDVNEAPTAVALANATASILENTPTATTSRWRTSMSPTTRSGATSWR